MNILITGTSKGLGYGLSRHYLEEGHNVYGISRSSNQELDDYNRFSFLSQDLSDFSSVKTNVPRFLEEVSDIQIVILNAGILNEIKDLRDTSLEEIKDTMDLNVWANKVLIDILFEEGKAIDRIVAISSGASVSASRGWNAYSLSKAALNMLISLYSKEYTDTHFSALAPGLIDSGMQEYISGLDDEKGDKFPLVKKLKKARGTSQMPSPDKAADLLASGISRLKSYSSGSFLDIRTM